MAGYVRTVLDGRYRATVVLAAAVQYVIVTRCDVGATSRDCIVCNVVGKSEDVHQLLDRLERLGYRCIVVGGR